MIVKDIAKAVGVEPHVIRYYARIGLLDPKRNPENGYKVFNGSDVERVKFIRSAQYHGLSLAEIQTLLDDSRRGTALCRARVREQLHRHQQVALEKIRELTDIIRRIECILPALDAEPGCDTLNHRSVCPLLQSVPANVPAWYATRTGAGYGDLPVQQARCA